MAWWGVWCTLAACNLTYEVFKPVSNDNEALWASVIALLHLIVLGGGVVGISICLKQATRCSGWKTAIAAFSIPTGGFILIFLCAIIIDYVFGLIALVGKSLM